jgi:hypothetical protein
MRAAPGSDEIRERDAQAAAQAQQHAIRRIELAALDRADVVAMESGAEAELLLGETLTDAVGADRAAERDVVGGSSDRWHADIFPCRLCRIYAYP